MLFRVEVVSIYVCNDRLTARTNTGVEAWIRWQDSDDDSAFVLNVVSPEVAEAIGTLMRRIMADIRQTLGNELMSASAMRMWLADVAHGLTDEYVYVRTDAVIRIAEQSGVWDDLLAD